MNFWTALKLSATQLPDPATGSLAPLIAPVTVTTEDLAGAKLIC